MSAERSTEIHVDTPAGTAAAMLDLPTEPSGLLVLGHGAGGGVDAADLVAVRDSAFTVGYAVVRVTQPYRLAGRRAPAPAGRLDEALLAVLAALRGRAGLEGLPLVSGGRSSGARVACRTAADAGADRVLALAFPLHPPGRPERSRAAELHAVGVPTLVVQGERDAFGSPGELGPELPPRGKVLPVRGADHGLRPRKSDPQTLSDVAGAVADWLRASADRGAG